MESDNEVENNDSFTGGIPPPAMFGEYHQVQQGIEWARLQYFGDTVPQIAPISDKQALNSAGGYAFKISDTMRVRRFLILGTTGGTYYATEQELKMENVKDILEMIKNGKEIEILREIYDVNKTNRAPKMTPLVFCLALVIRHSSDRVARRRAYQMLLKVCRIPTHLFEFVSACKSVVENKKMSWGRLARHYLTKWYMSKEVMALAMAVTKYQQRSGWSHCDVIRLTHPSARSWFLQPELKLDQLQLAEKQGTTDESDKNATTASSKHNDVMLYCVKGHQALCARYPDLTVVDPPVVRPPQPAKVPKEEKAEDARRRARKTNKSKKKTTATDSVQSGECKVDSVEKEPKTNGSAEPAQKKESKPPKEPVIRMRFLDEVQPHLKFLQAVEDLKACYDDVKAVELIRRFGLVREHVPSRLLSSVNVWRALLQNMPITAMIRNLAKMTAVGLLPLENNCETELVCRKLRDSSALKAARVHPLAILMALAVYNAGKGDKGQLKWVPNQSIKDALDDAFYAAFNNVQPTGKRFLLALDISGSMTCRMGGSCLSCRDASAALAMLTLRTEPVCEVVAFMDQLTPLALTKSDTLKEAVEKVSGLPFGGTDCALPMLWAAQNKKSFDCFVVYTDSETVFGDVHPSKAMQLYREKSGIHDAKLIVVGMTATRFTIADPDDLHMMDVVGFDASVPQLMRDFVSSGFEEPPAGLPPAVDDEAWSEALGD